MKIAHLIPQFYPHAGGAEICIHNVCETLIKENHIAVVVTSTAPPSEKPDISYKIEYLWEKTGGLFRNFPHIIGKAYLNYILSKLQKKYKFDLWQVTNGYPLGVYAVDFFNKNKIPCVLRCCGDDIQKFPDINYGMRLNPGIDRLVTAQYPRYDGFVALTPSVKEEYLKIGIREDRIRIIPNGVEIAKFADFKEEKKKAIREKYGITQGKNFILTVGRYHPKKGYDLIPKIAGELRGKGLDFVWLIVGKNSSEIRKKYSECDSLGIIVVEKLAKSAGNVFSLPSKYLIELYCSADIFAFPTLIETFGMVLVEAMAAGLPIVTTEAEGVRDVVENEITGLKTKPGDASAFAEALIRVIKNRELSEKLKLNCLKKVSDYDWSIVSGQYAEFYEELIKKFKS